MGLTRWFKSLFSNKCQHIFDMYDPESTVDEAPLRDITGTLRLVKCKLCEVEKGFILKRKSVFHPELFIEMLPNHAGQVFVKIQELKELERGQDLFEPGKGPG